MPRHPKPTNASTIALLRQRREQTGFLTAEEQFVLRRLERFEAGTHRQMTTEEIGAMYCSVHHAWKCTEQH